MSFRTRHDGPAPALRGGAVAACLGLAWTLLVAHAAFAQARLVVRPFEGTGAERAWEAVVGVLAEQRGVELVPEANAQAAAVELAADLNSSDGRVAVARKLALTCFVSGQVRKHGRALDVEISMYEGKTGALLDKATLRARAPTLARKVRASFMRELGPALFTARAPPAEPQAAAASAAEQANPASLASAPAPATSGTTLPQAPPAEPAAGSPPAEALAEPRAAERAGTGRAQPFELSFAVVVLTRQFRYREAPVRLPEHSLSPTPAALLSLAWYPAAHFTNDALAGLGLEASAQMMWPVQARSGSESHQTEAAAFGIGACFRLPLGPHRLGLSAAYGQQQVAFGKTSSGADAAVPDVAYAYARMGADARFALSSAFALKLGAAYLLPFGYGELGSARWFPHAAGGGLDAQLGLGYELSPLIELDAGLAFTRFFVSLHSEPDDPAVRDSHLVASGVADQFLDARFGITLRP